VKEKVGTSYGAIIPECYSPQQWAALITFIEAIETERQDTLSKTTMPVPGLSFDDDGILYNGLPLAQCSDVEKLMVSMEISMALNPTLRVLRIKDDSLLDKNNLAILQGMIRERQFQAHHPPLSASSIYGNLPGDGAAPASVSSMTRYTIPAPAPLTPPQAKRILFP
jgi:hypothetical protein